MSTPTSNMVFENFACSAKNSSILQKVREGFTASLKPTLRLALLYREELVFPGNSGWRIKILSGKAWVTFKGQDFLLCNDESLDIPKTANGAIISAVGNDALFFEVS
ncbi:MAG: hypothetical protein GYA15_03795 [Leptolinea sp.]|nr:hypothetical protein [Leptolinea sp.]